LCYTTFTVKVLHSALLKLKGNCKEGAYFFLGSALLAFKAKDKRVNICLFGVN